MPARPAPRGPQGWAVPEGPGHGLSPYTCSLAREETEIIEGEVVEIQIDRPATGTVSLLLSLGYPKGCRAAAVGVRGVECGAGSALRS